MARQNIFLLVAALLFEICSLSTAQPLIPAQKARTTSSGFAEVEILLSDEFGLADISALSTAPGSDLKVLDEPKRVVAQLPDSTVKNLLDAGADITVMKNFMLIKSAKSAYAEDGDVTAMSSCTGPYQEGSITGPFPIRDYPGYGDPIAAVGVIRISRAPPDATVTCIEVGWRINHSRPSDLVILLSDEDSTTVYPLWEMDYASPGDFSRTRTGITAFNGELVNQRWLLVMADLSAGNTGYIDSWWIKVYYAPPPPVCSGNYSSGENNTDVTILDDDPESPAVSEIDITDAPPGSSVQCIDVHYEIKHTYVGDLEVILTDSDRSPTYNLWNKQGGSSNNITETETAIIEFNGEPVNQTWILQAADTSGGDIGYIDSWWIKVYYEAEMLNDDCANAIALEEGIPYQGSTVGATGFYESSCSFNDTADVWHSYTPTNTGLFIISLAGSTFDTTLTVFNHCVGKELACNDDSCTGPNSEITMLMTGGDTYLIRVAGFNRATGNYTLTVTSSPAILPSEPNSPSPVDGAADVPTDTVFSWDCTITDTDQAQNSELVMALSKDAALQEGIFGKDDRFDEYAVAEPNALAAGDATVILMPQEFVFDNHDGTFTIQGKTFAEWYLQFVGRPLCPDEPFRNQPAPGMCSGFLVAPDIIATTGHCACPQECSDWAIVFGFVMLDSYTPVLRLNESEVYYCKEVIARQVGHPDWALIRLDRKVTGHNPLPLRHTGIVPQGEPLLVIGHPWGLPRKYAAGATVLDNTASAYFQANLDTYDGNSGSAVLSTNTLVVEGILYFGPEDFVEDGPCDRSNVCPDIGCPEWPHLKYVTRATEFSAPIPLFDVYLGTDISQLNLIYSDVAVPWCASGPLQTETIYYWQVVAKNCYSQTEGSIWSFTSAK